MQGFRKQTMVTMRGEENYLAEDGDEDRHEPEGDGAVPRGAEKVAILSTGTIVIRGTPSKRLRYSRIERRSLGDLRFIGYEPLTVKDCLNGLPGMSGKTP
jgi:hypothetical protein